MTPGKHDTNRPRILATCFMVIFLTWRADSHSIFIVLAFSVVSLILMVIEFNTNPR